MAETSPKVCRFVADFVPEWGFSARHELVALGANLRSSTRANGKGRAAARIVVGGDHAELVRMARDESTRRIFVSSHRFGGAGVPMVLAPSVAAAKKRGIDVSIYYGTTSGTFKKSGMMSVAEEFSSDGVSIIPILKPRIHAKLLVWDEDSIVITSQNWLSADPPDDSPRQEIGVFVQATGLAKILIGRFCEAVGESDPEANCADTLPGY